MKKKKVIIYSVIAIIIILTIGIVTFNILNDKNKLTSDERTWIDNNINTIQNVYTQKDANVFSKNGEGVFYSFLQSVSEEYGIQFNIVTSENPTGNAFSYTKELNNNKEIIYTDHYVVLSKNYKVIKSIEDLDGLSVGVLNGDLEYIKKYLKDNIVNLVPFEEEDIFTSLGDKVNYIILPRINYLDIILKNNLEIVYHLSDINLYYVFQNNNDTLGSILSKYLVNWEENINKSIKEQEFKIFTNALNIPQTEIDKLLSVDYHYGFVNNSPYEVIMSGNYGGIVKEYLQEFSEFSGVYFDITKYRNTDKLVSAINNGEVDIYFNFNKSINNKFLNTKYGINNSLAVITRLENNKVFNSIYGLQGEEVYVLKNSNLESYLKSIGNINIKTYASIKELFKLNHEDLIIVMDKYIFDYYKDSKLNNYVNKYDTIIDNKYTFKINNKYNTLSVLFNKYISYLDSSIVINNGINSHMNTMEKGLILNNIAVYTIFMVIILGLSYLIYYKNSKKIKLRKKLKKDDKFRFIDELTCLKNRTYLSDFLKTWSNNTIYPQSVIVIDLNKLQEINNSHGISEGDKQIQAAANALIKTQLDNSDLMRSDGNEFVIYTVGYNQKQIVNYIHKLSKELKKLPYNYGAEFGYSMIENNLKTVEDALTEALEDMKSKKKDI